MAAMTSLPHLPVSPALPKVASALERNLPVILRAPPGTGKTTLVAPYLMDAGWLAGRKILLLEPRRVAARAAARHIAGLLGEDVGESIGYHVRLERRVGPRTRVEILTEGLLTQRLLRDPELKDAGLVIFDEFHERSIHADMGLALCLDSRSALRPDLRLVVMSATLDVDALSEHLPDAEIVTAEAPAWPVETRLLDRASDSPIHVQAASAALRAASETDGGVLVFLPGEAEIHRADALLRTMALPPGTTVHPLYGAMSKDRQDAVLAPPLPGRRKIVLATSIAESSLTIPGIRAVVDSGWMRVPRFSARNGMSRLETLRVTRDRADQRRGRAGREAPGFCLRLWDAATDAALLPSSNPEILDTDLAPLALQTLFWGAPSRLDLPWITPPPDAAWRQAMELLRELGAVDGEGRLSQEGRRMASMPVHPRFARMILRAAEYGAARRACLLAAALGEAVADPRMRGETDASRILDLIDGVRDDYANDDDGAPRDWVSRSKRLAEQWARQFPRLDSARIDDGRMLAWAFPDRIARRRGAAGRYLMACGRGATLDAESRLSGEEWIVAVELRDDGPDARIRLAAAVSQDDAVDDNPASILREESVSWDRQADSVAAVIRTSLGAIPLKTAPLQDPPPEAVERALCDGVRAKGVGNLNWTKDARNLQGRIQFLAEARPEDGWPDVSDDALAARLEEWLAPHLEGMTRWSQVQKVDLREPLLGLLGPLRGILDRMAPTHLPVPSGSNISVRYDRNGGPVMSVRMQEVFGMAASPSVAGGRVQVVMELLSPAMRPLQVTRDLATFWRTTYALVRKEMRGRYPKHDWPEDPAAAVPHRGRRAPGK